MVKKGNTRVYVTLSEEQLNMIDKLSSLSGSTRSAIIQRAITDYIPSKLSFYERYYKGKLGIDPYTKDPLPEKHQQNHRTFSEEQGI